MIVTNMKKNTLRNSVKMFRLYIVLSHMEICPSFNKHNLIQSIRDRILLKHTFLFPVLPPGTPTKST